MGIRLWLPLGTVLRSAFQGLLPRVQGLGYGLSVPATLRDLFAVDVQSRNPIDILLPPVFLSWIVDVDDVKFEIALQTKVQIYVTVLSQ
jgi:hypothetical protein